jgi:hypothetical protein
MRSGVCYYEGMRERRSGVHVVTTTRKYKDREYRAHLLRRSYREGGRVKKETLGNITVLGDELVAVVRAGLRGEQVGVLDALLPPLRSRPHGHVRAVARAMERLGFSRLLASRASRERSIILALVAQRLLSPGSKLACTRKWHASSLADVFGVGDVRVDEVFDAMDWLIERKGRIEERLAARHLLEGTPTLFDLSSSYVEGSKNELAAFGNNRDKKRGKRQVNYGVLTDALGRPAALRVFPGNTSDAAAVRAVLLDVRAQFGLREVLLIGDRGMITSKHVREFQADDASIQWISALRGKDIQQLMLKGALQVSLFEETNLVEFESLEYPGERLVACRNPLLAAERAHHREALLQAASEKLERIARRVAKGRLKVEQTIALKVGAALAQHKMGKHYQLEIREGHFSYQRNPESINREAATDGVYVIRSNAPAARHSAADLVRRYKDLRYLEQLFGALKGVDLAARPIHHRKADRTEAHLFICLLAYYLRWHLERAWATLTYRDHDPLDAHERDPVAPAKRSHAAASKAATHTTPTGDTVHSFKTLLESLGTIVRNTHQHPESGATITLDTIPTPHQQHALELIETINP